MITIAAPTRKGRDSVKLTALSPVIPETPRTKKGAQLLAAPTNAQNSTKMKSSKTILTTQTRTRDESNRASRRMKQEETQKQSKLFKVKSSTLYFAFMNIVLEFHK